MRGQQHRHLVHPFPTPPPVPHVMADAPGHRCWHRRTQLTPETGKQVPTTCSPETLAPEG